MLSGNLGKLYKTINASLSHKDGIAPLRDPSGSIIYDDLGKANLLNSHFINSGTKDNGEAPTIIDSPIISNHISEIHFDPEDVHTSIGNLKNNCSSGPDGVNIYILKNLNHILCFHLAELFSLVFKNGVIPDGWKGAFVCPIFKKGSSADPNNYRPISITSLVCKLFETIVKNQLLAFLCTFSILNPSQHGFISGHSTVFCFRC